MPNKKRKTMKDVARLAGVSQSTVSFVLNNTEEAISDATKKRVYEAVRQLNFVPRAKIQNYTKISDNVIAIVVPNISNLFYPFLIKYINIYAQAKDYKIIIVNTNRDSKNEQDYYKFLINMKIAGIIYGFTPSLSDIIRAKGLNIPLVVIGETDEDFETDIVTLNSYKAGELLAAHLLELNHKRISFITSPIEGSSLSRKRRLQGLSSGLRGYAELDVITDHQEYEYDDANYEIELGYNETVKLFKYGKQKPTAVVGANDMIAIGVIKALNELNISLPGEVSVAGFDNIPISELISPALTTVEHCTAQRAKLAIDLLHDKINGKSQFSVRVNYDPILITRNSTGSPCA